MLLLHRQQIRMTDRTDQAEGLHLLVGTVGRAVEMVGARNELDGLLQSAGRFALPDFAEAPLAERFQQAIARNRLRV